MTFEAKIRWISASIKPAQLAELKCRFKSHINSKKKYSQVKDFFDLVGILIIRGSVSSENVTVIDDLCQEYLKISYSQIPDSQNIASSLYTHGNLQPFSTSVVQPSVPSDYSNGNSTSGPCSADPNSNDFLPAAIDIIVDGRISEKHWRPFARALKVDTERVTQETSVANKIQKVLTIFLQDIDLHEQRQWPLLEVALEKINRIDLRDKCRELFNSHS